MLGQRLHNFAIMRLLGEGGMSSVYEAEHALIRRKVAVKVLKSELSVDGAQVQRFFNEARATSAIRHPNIVEVIDVGRLADGVPYLVMELLEGESLGERLERVGTLDVPVALDFVHQAASALVAAHALRIVHRDLKPDNLFLVPDQRIADRELVKVLDFGIAKLRGDLAAPPFDTMVGAVLGTPPYMSPEQCRGLPEEIDDRTDIYALGIILYEMLCGEPPFMADGAGELMMMHMTVQPEPPSKHNRSISPELESVILRALEKRREDRFETMAELDAALLQVAETYGVIEPYAVRRVPAAVGGGVSAVAVRTTSRFESDTTLNAALAGPSADAQREQAVTRALSRRSEGREASGTDGVAVGLNDPVPKAESRGESSEHDAVVVGADIDASAIEGAADAHSAEIPVLQPQLRQSTPSSGRASTPSERPRDDVLDLAANESRRSSAAPPSRSSNAGSTNAGHRQSGATPIAALSAGDALYRATPGGASTDADRGSSRVDANVVSSDVRRPSLAEMADHDRSDPHVIAARPPFRSRVRAALSGVLLGIAAAVGILSVSRPAGRHETSTSPATRPRHGAPPSAATGSQASRRAEGTRSAERVAALPRDDARVAAGKSGEQAARASEQLGGTERVAMSRDGELAAASVAAGSDESAIHGRSGGVERAAGSRDAAHASADASEKARSAEQLGGAESTGGSVVDLRGRTGASPRPGGQAPSADVEVASDRPRSSSQMGPDALAAVDARTAAAAEPPPPLAAASPRTAGPSSLLAAPPGGGVPPLAVNMPGSGALPLAAGDRPHAPAYALPSSQDAPLGPFPIPPPGSSDGSLGAADGPRASSPAFRRADGGRSAGGARIAGDARSADLGRNAGAVRSGGDARNTGDARSAGSARSTDDARSSDNSRDVDSTRRGDEGRPDIRTAGNKRPSSAARKSGAAAMSRTGALSLAEFEAEAAAANAAERPATANGAAAANGAHPPSQLGAAVEAQAPQPAEGYLSLDSAPWSDVFLGSNRLGTTPLIRVPLPAGKYLLTLRNPELGTSTSYAVEIVAGKTVSRLVGWDHR